MVEPYKTEERANVLAFQRQQIALSVGPPAVEAVNRALEAAAKLVEDEAIREDRSLMTQYATCGEICDSYRVNLALAIRGLKL